MKTVSNLLAALVFASLVIFMSCGGGGDDPDPTNAELNAEILSGTTWEVNSPVQYGTGNSEGDWADFRLTVNTATATSATYSVVEVPDGYEVVWPENGSWTVDDDNGEDISRNDGIAIDITVENNQLTLRFTIPDPDNARVSGLFDETWLFDLKPAE